MEAVKKPIIKAVKPPAKKRKITLKILYKQRVLFLMSVPFVIWCVIFNYLPIWGWTMAFQRYTPGLKFSEQPWAGLDQFKELFADPHFYRVLKNTLGMSILGLVFGTVTAIGFALLLNEIAHMKFKKAIQTISYLPHFVSWVIAASLISTMLSVDGGAINELLVNLHITSKPIAFLAKKDMFWGINAISYIWKETGWNAIIYLAAIAGIDPSLYEAASVDGASRLRKIWHITLPGIRPTIIILLVLNIGNLINIGYEQQWLLGNNLVKDTSEVLDLYALNYGIQLGNYSFGTAIGVFKSIVGLTLVLAANGFAKKIGEGQII